MARGQPELIFGDGPQDIGDFGDRSRAVCLIKNKNTNERGSGFFSKVSVDSTGDIYGIFTCNHVLGSELEAENADVVFDYEGNMAGEKVKLKPEIKFLTNEELDYTFIGINEEDVANLKCSVNRPIQPIIMEPKLEAKIGDRVIIVQHPGGKSKKWSLDTILAVEKPFVSYKADTEGGSSGSPVFTYAGHKLIAIHNGGFKGDCNRGTLCCEVLKHITTGTYTKPGGSSSSSENEDSKPTEGFSKSQAKPSDQVLNKVARKICAVWQDLGPELKVPAAKIDEILVNNVMFPTVQQKAYQMLKAWKNRGESVTYDELKRALEELDLNELAESLSTT